MPRSPADVCWSGVDADQPNHLQPVATYLQGQAHDIRPLPAPFVAPDAAPEAAALGGGGAARLLPRPSNVATRLRMPPAPPLLAGAPLLPVTAGDPGAWAPAWPQEAISRSRRSEYTAAMPVYMPRTCRARKAHTEGSDT